MFEGPTLRTDTPHAAKSRERFKLRILYKNLALNLDGLDSLDCLVNFNTYLLQFRWKLCVKGTYARACGLKSYNAVLILSIYSSTILSQRSVPLFSTSPVPRLSFCYLCVCPLFSFFLPFCMSSSQELSQHTHSPLSSLSLGGSLNVTFHAKGYASICAWKERTKKGQIRE